MERRILMATLATTTLVLSGCAASGATGEGDDPSASREHRHHTIDYIELAVLDVAEAKRFYGAAFGWTFNDYGPDYAGIRKAGGGEVGGLRQDANVRPGGPLVILYSADLEASERAVRDAGGRIVKEIFAFPGGRRFQFTDPSGNELAVWSDG